MCSAETGAAPDLLCLETGLPRDTPLQTSLRPDTALPARANFQVQDAAAIEQMAQHLLLRTPHDGSPMGDSAQSSRGQDVTPDGLVASSDKHLCRGGIHEQVQLEP